MKFLLKKIYKQLLVCTKEEGVSVVNIVSESEMLVKFVTWDEEI